MYWENVSEYDWKHNNLKNNKELNIRREEKNNHPCIYVDMDGTLFKWNRMKSKEFPDGVTTEMVFSPGYFRNLKPNQKIVDLVKALYDKGWDIRIASKSAYFAIQEKYESLQEYLPFIDKNNIFFIPLEADKTDFLPEIKENDILIDDYNPNLNEFKGSSIKCVTEMNTINPKYPWIKSCDNIFKNFNVITWTLVREWQKSQSSDNPLSKQDLKEIYEKSYMNKEDFLSLCEGFGIDLENYSKNEDYMEL